MVHIDDQGRKILDKTYKRVYEIDRRLKIKLQNGVNLKGSSIVK